MTSSPHGLYIWVAHVLQWEGTERCETARWSKSHKTSLSSDCRLQLAYMKLESLVIAYQLRRGEYVPEPCTHRPSHHGSWLYPKSVG